MSRMSSATPCPAPTRRQYPNRLSIASTNGGFGDDTCTQDIDYTRAIQHEFNNARPRRKSTFPRKPDRHAPGIAIFEDVVEGEELVVEQTKMVQGRTLLGRPARKMPAHVVKSKGEEWMGAQPLGEIGQARQRTSIAPRVPSIRPVVSRAQAETATAVREGLKKDPRRRTIFVPPGDTTCLTIHPGANNTDRLDDTFQLPGMAAQPFAEPSVSVMDYELEPEEPPRRPRMSLDAAPKRLPLQQMALKLNNLPGVDVPGQNGGKENLPPRTPRVDVMEYKPVKPSVSPAVAGKASMASSRLHEPTAASQARQTVVVRRTVPVSRAQSSAATARTLNAARTRLAQQKAAPVRTEPAPYQSARCLSGKEEFVKPWKRTPPTKTALAQVNRLSQYPVLPEDVSQPQLYEESWLSHQEIALTELVNEMFESTQPATPAWQAPDKSVREHMLSIYHQPGVATLHKRLQASLLYGALSRPKDMPSPPDPARDLGLRKRFLNLWLQTYNEDALRTAAEVVMGRQIVRNSCGSPSTDLAASESVLDPSKRRRALIGFLETFLVSVCDVESTVDEPEEPQSADGRRWRKMVLRSLMLIWLLDQAKKSGAVTGSLFKRTSCVKSSTLVLHTLSGLLIPSIGDVIRVLRHFDYEVGHVQDPLDEVIYRINNIAVDLRDGILLCRLVETVLFASRLKAADADKDATVTLALPDMTFLESALYTKEGLPSLEVLSQHLKMPCLGRAQRLHNVQVALSALNGQETLTGIVIPVATADEIVDGHREKTLSLLWSLVSNYGLAHLVDWDELAADIRRTGADAPTVERPVAQGQHESLLQAWAAAYCAREGINVRNLTTSFADGNAYAIIVDAFSAFLPSTIKGDAHTSLETKLRSLGCSAAFCRQLAASTNAIPSRNTTVSNLAFLASRLLPLARRHNAAVVIQRTYRRILSWKRLTQRVALMRLASACATVVRTRNRLVAAATVLQRSWRGVLDARLSKLNQDVNAFQLFARGWAVRRRTRKAIMCRSSSVQSLRVMGGW
ncbi:hypothetical protein LTR36_008799 [Oleoguttula mirabilis]|uniref:Calponin-homology (CH) domain-containing protein n=1 Tax=Oleoguttula mirabilis TaxID=1507867 RepID=A0AAV9J750_9PEZI|nr:hypothetical protein LTR36_008799 [Oleoguttula mirabilis]